MSSSGPERSLRPETLPVTALLGGLIVLALVVRFWKLGTWNLEATEIFTLKDSLHPRLTNPRPLSYLLNYYLIRPMMPLDEFGLRLLPAIFGVLAIPAIFYASRRLIGVRAALYGAGLLTISDLHVFYSQFARYWALVILLCAIYPFALYRGIRDRDRAAIAVGLVSAVLAVLAHPVSILLAGGPIIWFMVEALRPASFRRWWAHRAVRWSAVAALVLGLAVAVRFVPILHSWITVHDENPGSGQFLNLPKPNGLKQFVYLSALVESLTLPLVLAAAAGIYLLWQRERSLALLLTSLAAFPIAFLTLLSARTAVSQFYLVPVLPVFFMAAGVFIDRLSEIHWPGRPRWLLPALVTTMVLAAGGPTLISQYRNGRRFDFRGVAIWLTPQLTRGDVIYSDQPMVLAHYLPGTRISKLRTADPMIASLDSMARVDARAALWVVAPAPAHAFRTTLRQGGLADFMWSRCQLRNTVGTGRLDFRQQYLQVYRCPPLPPGTAG